MQFEFLIHSLEEFLLHRSRRGGSGGVDEKLQVMSLSKGKTIATIFSEVWGEKSGESDPENSLATSSVITERQRRGWLKKKKGLRRRGREGAEGCFLPVRMEEGKDPK